MFRNEFVNHSGHWGNVVQSLAQWRHPVASSEALDVLHRAMDPASYRLIRMTKKIARELHVFFVIVDSLVTYNLR